MGKVPTLAIIAVALVLIIGISVAAFYFLIKPRKEGLAKLKQDLVAEQAVVAEKQQAELAKQQVDEAWLRAQRELEALRERKSIPISMYMPLLAMTTIWYEYRDDLPKVVEAYLQGQGVVIEQGATIPAPPLSPPTVPSSGFMQVPSAAPLNLTIKGTLAQIQRVYENLAQLPRVATIGALSLSGSGQQLSATFPLSLYILVEGPKAVAPPAPAGGGETGAPGMEPGGKGPPEGPKGGGAKGGGAKGGGDKAEDEDGGGESKAKAGDGGDGGGGGDE